MNEKRLPESILPKEIPPTKLDIVVGKFGEILGFKETAIKIKQELYATYSYGLEKELEHEDIITKVENEIGGKILLELILTKMRVAYENTTEGYHDSKDAYLTLEDYIARLKNMQALEVFLPSLDPQNPEVIRAGLLEIFENGVREILEASPKKEVLLSIINGAINRVLVGSLFKAHSLNDELGEVVDNILREIESVGNMLFKQMLQENRVGK